MKKKIVINFLNVFQWCNNRIHFNERERKSYSDAIAYVSLKVNTLKTDLLMATFK